jgi:hypothetical protein
MKTHDWKPEITQLLLAMKKIISAHKTTEDPFSNMTTIRCCKEEPEIPTAVYGFLTTANPHDDQNHKFAIQSLHYLVKHNHLNPCKSTLAFWVAPGSSSLYFCKTCFNHNPIPISPSGSGSPTVSWLHACAKDEWAITNPGVKPIIKWHMGAACWTFTYSYHNHVEEFLSKDPKHYSFDEKNKTWLIADAVIPQTVANLKQWLADLVFLDKSKRTGGNVSRASASPTAIYAETILSFLPPDELKSLTRKVHMNLHPDRGGKQEDFVKFNLALEGWEKSRKP